MKLRDLLRDLGLLVLAWLSAVLERTRPRGRS